MPPNEQPQGQPQNNPGATPPPTPEEKAVREEFIKEMERRREAAPESQYDPAITIRPAHETPQEGGLVGLIIKTGLVKDAAQAQMVLAGIAIAAIGLIVWINFF
jgi:hypothetical protein